MTKTAPVQTTTGSRIRSFSAHPAQRPETPVRRSSAYTFEVSTLVPVEVLGTLKERCSVPLAASGVDYQRAFIRFRAANDEQAIEVVRDITDLDGVLHTGYGVNRRDIER